MFTTNLQENDRDESGASTRSQASRAGHDLRRNARIEILRAAVARIRQELGFGGAWVLELGCGHGHFLTAYASQHPEARCLGVDFSRDRIRRAERKQQRAGCANLRFIHSEVSEFFEALPADMVFRRTFVLFPDPWPKRRHRKHRLVSTQFLRQVAAVGEIGSEFFLRSDALDYVAEVRAFVSAETRWRLLSSVRLPFTTETVFQAKARQFDSLGAELVS